MAPFTPLLLAAALLLGGTSVEAAPVEAIDDAGTTVRLPAPARRIVSVAPHLTELLFSAGAGDRVVGAVAYSDHPEAARRIPRVGDSAQLDVERILALQPDLIVVWHHGTPALQLQRLRRLGIPLYAGESRTMADIASTLRRLGALTGTAATAEARATAFEQQVAALRRQYAGRTPLRVFYQIWPQPLMTVNGRHLISEALALCGARNLFAELAPLTPTVTLEAVAALDPDAIVSGSIAAEAAADLAGWQRLGSLRAVREKRLLVVDPDRLHRQSDRVVDGARELCGKLDALRR
jgi:iron complex transport system substrate-binding protein